MDRINEVLENGIKTLGIDLSETALNKFDIFTNELLEWNKVMNLTAITEPSEIAETPGDTVTVTGG